jgi:hypothetical protein
VKIVYGWVLNPIYLKKFEGYILFVPVFTHKLLRLVALASQHNMAAEFTKWLPLKVSYVNLTYCGIGFVNIGGKGCQETLAIWFYEGYGPGG